MSDDSRGRSPIHRQYQADAESRLGAISSGDLSGISRLRWGWMFIAGLSVYIYVATAQAEPRPWGEWNRTEHGAAERETGVAGYQGRYNPWQQESSSDGVPVPGQRHFGNIGSRYRDEGEKAGRGHSRRHSEVGPRYFSDIPRDQVMQPPAGRSMHYPFYQGAGNYGPFIGNGWGTPYGAMPYWRW